MATPDAAGLKLLAGKRTKYDGGVPTPEKAASKWGKKKPKATEGAPAKAHENPEDSPEVQAAKKSFIKSVLAGAGKKDTAEPAKKARTNYAEEDSSIPAPEVQAAIKEVRAARVEEAPAKEAKPRTRVVKDMPVVDTARMSRKPRTAADSPERIIADAEKMEKTAKAMREKAKALAHKNAVRTATDEVKELEAQLSTAGRAVIMLEKSVERARVKLEKLNPKD